MFAAATAAAADAAARLRGDLDESIGETPTAAVTSTESMIPVLTLLVTNPSAETGDRGVKDNSGGGRGGMKRWCSKALSPPTPPLNKGDA